MPSFSVLPETWWGHVPPFSVLPETRVRPPFAQRVYYRIFYPLYNSFILTVTLWCNIVTLCLFLATPFDLVTTPKQWNNESNRSDCPGELCCFRYVLGLKRKEKKNTARRLLLCARRMRREWKAECLTMPTLSSGRARYHKCSLSSWDTFPVDKGEQMSSAPAGGNWNSWPALKSPFLTHFIW